MSKVQKDVSQRNDDLDLGEAVATFEDPKVEFIDPETNEEVWLEEVKPRRRVTKKELEKEIFRLRNKLEDRDGRKALLMMHMIAEVAAIITLAIDGINPADFFIILILAIHAGASIVKMVKAEK